MGLPRANSLRFSVFCIAVFLLTAEAKVVTLNETNWNQALVGEWMLEFMAPWCPACVSLKNTWASLGSNSKELGITVAEIDVTEAPGLSGRFLVTALPTIYHVINGEFRQYKGPRDGESLYTYVEAKRWKNVDPVPWWKDPNSVQMSFVSYFFKMSQMLRYVHNVLLETYGLPTWGSYLVFALATLLLGSLVGLLMVACIDFLYPQKTTTGKIPPVVTPPKEAAEVMNDDLFDEETENSEEHDSQTSDRDEEKNSPSDTNSSDSEDDKEEEDEKELLQPSPSVRKRNKTPKTD